MPNPAAEEKKALGNAEFKKQNFQAAIDHYTEAINIDDSQHTYWSNRAACYAGLNDWSNSARDAENCIRVKYKYSSHSFVSTAPYLSQLYSFFYFIRLHFSLTYYVLSFLSIYIYAKVNKTFIKGYYRLALAQKNLCLYDASSATILSGLAKDSSNNDLKKLQKEVTEFLRVEKVEALLKTAKEQESNKEYGPALRTYYIVFW